MHSSLPLAAALVTLLCLSGQCGAQVTTPAPISCYNCTTDYVTGADNSNCGTAGASTPTAGGCSSCSLTLSYPAGVPVYTRGCSSSIISNNYCTPSGTCYCYGTLCNTHAFSTLGSLQCYSCSSANGIDNGCGPVVNPNSIYVTKLSGCTACGLSIAPSAPVRSGGGWTRSCLHDTDVNSTCSNNVNPSCFYRCTTNLCNTSAARPAHQAALSTLGAALALVAAALKLAA